MTPPTAPNNRSPIYYACCEDCGWEYESKRRSWTKGAAENHEALYREVEGHETTVERR